MACPFEVWAALQAAADAGDAKARTFLLTFGPWALALLQGDSAPRA